MRHALLILIALALAACQPLPRPFADDKPAPGAPILQLKDSVGVVVHRIDQAPEAANERISEGMAEALRRAEIPAGTTTGNRKSFQLIGAAETSPAAAGRTTVSVRWELHDDTGKAIGRETAEAEIDSASWEGGSPGLVAAFVAPAAPKIAALVQDEAPLASVDADGPVIRVPDVEGAPGDGPQSLRRAMNAALKQAKLAVAAGAPSGREWIVAGNVQVAPPFQGQQKVKIIWALRRPDGREVGQISQENAVPAGSLDRNWGDVAYVVATAAAESLVALLEKAQALPISGT